VIYFFYLNIGEFMPDTATKERRRHERFSIYCPLEYKSEDTFPKESSITLNVSESGALIATKRELPVDSNLILKFTLQDELFFIIGKVRHVRQAESEDSYEVGVEFWDKPRTFVSRFMEELSGIMQYRAKYKEEQGDDITLAEASIGWYKEASL